MALALILTLLNLNLLFFVGVLVGVHERGESSVKLFVEIMMKFCVLSLFLFA